MISQHFSSDEFACHCGCGKINIDNELLIMAERFRAHLCKKYKKEIRINVHCVMRCQKHNDDVCGSPNSMHLLGYAMDCHSDDISILQLHDSAKGVHGVNNILSGGLGLYSWGIHFDVGRYRTWMEQ